MSSIDSSEEEDIQKLAQSAPPYKKAKWSDSDADQRLSTSSLSSTGSGGSDLKQPSKSAGMDISDDEASIQSPRRNGYTSSSNNSMDSESQHSNHRQHSVDDHCDCCNHKPCYYYIHKDNMMECFELQYEIEEKLIKGVVQEIYKDVHGNVVSNKYLRKSLYKYYVYFRYGHLGKGNRVKVETCVTEHIRNLFPEKDNKYMGFKLA